MLSIVGELKLGAPTIRVMQLERPVPLAAALLYSTHYYSTHYYYYGSGYTSMVLLSLLLTYLLWLYLLWLYLLWQGFFSQRIARAAEAWAGHNWTSRMLYIWSFHRTAEVGFLFAGVVTFVAYATREQRSAEARRDARTPHAHAAPAAPMHRPLLNPPPPLYPSLPLSTPLTCPFSHLPPPLARRALSS